MAVGKPKVVTDASVTIAWCFPEENTPYAQAIFASVQIDYDSIAPPLWAYEVRNVLLLALRKGRANAGRIEEIFLLLDELAVDLSYPESFESVFRLAERSGLTYYDAAYLELAIREGAAIATIDKALRKAAKDHGVEVLGL